MWQEKLLLGVLRNCYTTASAFDKKVDEEFLSVFEEEFSVKSKIPDPDTEEPQESVSVEEESAEESAEETDEKKKHFVYYASPPPNNLYIHIPASATIRRVPQYVLGTGVLGVAFPGASLIYIRDDLDGNDFTEVQMHEIKHLQYPHLSELEIRRMTRRELPFYPRYH